MAAEPSWGCGSPFLWEERSTTDLPETVLEMTPEKEILTPGEVIEMPQASF